MKHPDLDLSGSKILIIDDTLSNMDIIRGILEKQRYRVFAAPSGEIGLTIAPRVKPDLILLDVMMPGIDGWETCTRLKKDPRTKNIPVIFVSAKTAIEDIAKGFKVGGVDYISKPIRREELIARVRTRIENTVMLAQQENLTQQLEEKNKALIDTQQQLVHAQKTVSLGTLTADIAHGINDPNHFIHASAQSLDADIKQLKSQVFNLIDENTDQSIVKAFHQQFDPLAEHIKTIAEGSTRITAILKDLSTFSQLDAYERKSVNIGDCLQAAINLVSIKHAKTAQFITNVAADIDLYCHPAQLNQVFIHLIVNACDAISQRQKKDSQLQGEIHIHCQRLDDSVIISVKDNGCGMNTHTQKQIFDPFYSTKSVGEGSGLGLSIAYGIAKYHGGELKVVSNDNQGSIFTLSLPHVQC